MRKGRVVVAAVLIAALIGTAPAPAAPRSEGSGVHLPSPVSPARSKVMVRDGAMTVERGPATAADAIALAAERLGADAPMGQVLAVAARLRTEQIFDVRIPGTGMAHESLVAVDASTYASRDAIPAGDLDGDGRQDLVTFDFVYDDDYTPVERRFAARRGSDGTVLWEAEQQYINELFAVPLGADVTGDGRADLLQQSVAWTPVLEDVCLIGPCVAYDTITWTIDVLNGHDGTLAWRKTVTGTILHTSVWALVAAAGREEASAVMVEMHLAGDQDGDGARDLIANVLDVDWVAGGAVAAVLVGGGVWVSDVNVALRGEVLAGSDGDTIRTITRPRKRGNAALVPGGASVGDATGDLILLDQESTPRADVCAFALVGFVCASLRPTTVAVTMFDGATGAASWTRRIAHLYGDDAFALEQADADLNGDGSDDVLIRQMRRWPFGPAATLVMLDGRSGARGWESVLDDEAPVSLDVIGPAGGAAGEDLADVSVVWLEDDDVLVATRILDGATGATLRTATHIVPTPADGYAEAWAWTANMDGDATLDVVLISATADFAPEPAVKSSRVIAQSGATGAELVDRSVPEWGAWLVEGDLNGSGRDDLTFVVVTGEGFNEVRFDAYLDPDGPRTWTRTDGIPVGASGIYDLMFPGDLDGDGGVDPVIELSAWVGDSELARYDAIAGATGAVLWGYGDAIEASPGGYGSIAGTVFGTEGPLAGVCVYLWEENAGHELDYDATGDDGSYAFTHLAAGPFLLEFVPCAATGYVREWYDDKTSFETADRIHLPAGLDLTGVNVTLQPPPPPGVPANDDAAAATDVGSLPYSDLPHLQRASAQDGESLCAGERTVWYRWTPDVDQPVWITADGGDATYGVSVFTAADPLGSQPDVCGQRSLSFIASGGVTYWIQIGTDALPVQRASVRIGNTPPL